MRGITLASLLIPPEAYALLIVAGGFLIMIGFRRTALAIFGFVVLSIALPPFLEPLLAELPDWVIWTMLAGFVLSILRLIMGPEIWANMWGTFFGNVLTGLARGMVRVPVHLVRMIAALTAPRRRD
jgi:hypothetical protein